MKVKCFDEQHEDDLTESINRFIENKQVIDIKFHCACFYDGEEQIYCFSALVLFNEL